MSLYQVFEHWDYQTTLVDISSELQRNVTEQDLITEIESSIKASEFDDARMYLSIAQSNQYPIESAPYLRQIEKLDTKLSRLQKNVGHFTQGFINGKSTNAAGIAGAVSADFTVIGDVRDLRKEYKKQQQGEEVNELIVALSGAGIGLTALTVGSLGSAAPAKSGISLIKLASKTRRLTTRFQKQLLRLGRKVFDWQTFTRLIKESKGVKESLQVIPRAAKQAYHPKAVEPLRVIAKQVNGVRRSTSVTDTLHLLKYVETSDDLRHLEKISLKHGAKTKGIMKLLGKGALRTVRVLRKSAELILSLISSVLSGLMSLVLLFSGRR